MLTTFNFEFPSVFVGASFLYVVWISGLTISLIECDSNVDYEGRDDDDQSSDKETDGNAVLSPLRAKKPNENKLQEWDSWK